MSELRIFHIRVRIHLLFWAVIALAIITGYITEILALFVIVIIHELGHVAAAREIGWNVTEIQLLPFGGVVTIEDAAASEPLSEIVVAIAGPFMNIAMVFLSLLLWKFGVWSAEWTRFFVTSNFIIAGFNMLPIWPLDGGRIVQALLHYSMSFRTATLISFGASILFAALMLGLGFFFLQLNVIAIASYLIYMNGEAYIRFPFFFIRFLMEKYWQASENIQIRSVLLTPSTTAIEASEHIRRGYTHLFYVKGDKGGMISEERLLHALLFERKAHTAVVQLL